MYNYRVTFGGQDIDYKSNFKDCRHQWPIIAEIFDIVAADHGIEFIWWFEPYTEITWLAHNTKDGEAALEAVTDFLDNKKIEYATSTPADGQFADWYGLTPEEREWGAIRYATIAREAMWYYDHQEMIDKGFGLDQHYMRSTHVLANQLALNYKREGILLIKRGILALLFWWLGHKKAVWVYTKIMRQRYL